MRYDGIAVGASTLISDNPTLDPIMFDPNARSPWKMVFDPSLRAAKTFWAKSLLPNILKSTPNRVVWLCLERAEKAEPEVLNWLKQLHIDVMSYPAEKIDPDAVIRDASARGISSLLLEGGAGLYGPFLDAGRVHRIHHFTALRLMGKQGDILNIETGRDNRLELNLTDVELTPLDHDLLIEGWIK
jgi:diaminohydroxyphosphoribosylaminopyrimidine deaminase/5-amino-6-(5-phosphoribosylamino)uracil reductase